MIKSEEIEKVYELVKDIEGIEFTNAFAIENSGFSEDFELIRGKSSKGIFELYCYDDMLVFVVEYPNGERTHWHPWEVEDAVLEVEKFMGNKMLFNNLKTYYYSSYGIVFSGNEDDVYPGKDSKVFVISDNKPDDYQNNFWILNILKDCKSLICHGKHVNGQNYYFLSIINEFDAFVSKIYESATSGKEDVFLFYDNRITYNKVINALKKLKKETK